ncbi:MAG: class I SAM-dependent methyltransferase [Planctomycetes bacterium]|nr:class I SAM-dependent methyltransferase [Planctomycetota bacterium]
MEALRQAQELRIRFETCPLCECRTFVPLGETGCRTHAAWSAELPEKLAWVGCQACGHVFTDGYWSEAALARIFATEHAQQTPGQDVEAARRISAKVVTRVSELRGEFNGRWLDVGFGDGSLLTTAEEFGYEVVGLDLRESCVRRMREFGYTVERRTLIEFQDARGFDVISLCDVLEHIALPKQALVKVKNLLAPHGLLMVSCPNMDSFAWKWLDQRGQNPYWSELEHHHNFGRERLCALLVECGLEPIHYAISERYKAGMEVVARRR